MQKLPPLKLRHDNFTPLARTPWAGFAIAKTFKAHLDPTNTPARIGESWEFSCDPAFPSMLINGISLFDFIKGHPDAALGPGVTEGTNCELLIKLIEASEPLSLQVHPRDDDPFLGAGECGKPESWLVLDHEPGAGLYLGFSRAIAAEVINSGKWSADMLNFVPVRKGDYFEIQPGVPHAVGPGVCLLEPQRIVFGETGKTYRLWDWDRRYDENGNLDPINGKPRALHVAEGGRLVDGNQQVGAAFLQTLARTPSLLELPGSNISSYPANDYYQTHICETKVGHLFKVGLAGGGYAAFVGTQGAWSITNKQGSVSVLKGQTVFLANSSFPLEFASESGHSCGVLVAAMPAKLLFDSSI